MRNLKFDYDDTVYTIEFDRRAFVNAENAGFDMGNSVNTPLKSATLLFAFGLQKNHPTLQTNKIDKIIDSFIEIHSIDEFLSFCLEEYTGFFMTTQSSSKERQKLDIQTK